jgi:hypothetical protein
MVKWVLGFQNGIIKIYSLVFVSLFVVEFILDFIYDGKRGRIYQFIGRRVKFVGSRVMSGPVVFTS